MSLMLTNKFKLFILVAGSLFGLTSCQTKAVTPGAERLRIFEAEPKGCLYMGEVSTVQENEDTIVAGKDVDMNLNSRIDLRNKAFALSGNVVVFMSKSKAKVATTSAVTADIAKKDGASTKAADDKSEKVAQSVFLATVFRCPPLIFNQ